MRFSTEAWLFTSMTGTVAKIQRDKEQGGATILYSIGSHFINKYTLSLTVFPTYLFILILLRNQWYSPAHKPDENSGGAVSAARILVSGRYGPSVDSILILIFKSGCTIQYCTTVSGIQYITVSIHTDRTLQYCISIYLLLSYCKY